MVNTGHGHWNVVKGMQHQNITEPVQHFAHVRGIVLSVDRASLRFWRLAQLTRQRSDLASVLHPALDR